MFSSQQKLKKIYNLWLALVEMIASKSFKHDILKTSKIKNHFCKESKLFIQSIKTKTNVF